MTSFFKSEQGKAEILALYDEKLAGLKINYTEATVPTTFGKTKVLITGEASNPPLIIVHGSNGCAPIGLETYPNLSEKFQVFAVDVLAQPNKTEGIRPSMKGDAYGRWLNEVITFFGLQEVVLVGFSFGGLVILKTLIHQPRYVKAAYLAAPAYIVNGNPLKAMFKVFIPMRRYMNTKNTKFIHQFLGILFTKEDKFAVRYLSKVFLNFEMDFTPVPVISKKEAAKIHTPLTIFAAKDDLLFPGKKMIKRAKTIFPNLIKAILFEDSKHVQNDTHNEQIEGIIFSDNFG